MIERLEPRRLLSGIPPVPAPAAHWSFDEGSGTTANDSSGNGNTATLGTGVSWVAGNVGPGAISLNGSASAVVTAFGPVVDTANSFTASAWVDLNNVSGYQTVLSIAGTNVAGFFLQLRSDTGSFAFTRLASDSTSATTTYVAAPSAPVAGTWYHIVGVDDTVADTLTLYVDGQSVGTASYSGNWEATGNTLIGHGFYSGGQVDYVNGEVDDVQLFASALSAAQVAALDQPAAFTFEEGSGNTSADVSGHGNTLTLATGAAWGAGYSSNSSLALNGTAAGNATTPAAVVNTAQSFSVSAWVYLNSLNSYQTFVSIDGTNTSGFYLQLNGSNNKFAFTRLGSDSDSATNYQADSTAAATTGTWYNLVGVNDVATKQILLYVNGALQSTVAYTSGWQASGPTVIGGGLFNGVRSDFVNGDIDNVQFYDSPISAGDALLISTGGGSILTVATNSTGATVPSTFFGAFMEDINYGGEGGIYNDEVRNSGFNDSTNPLNAWAAVASSGVSDSLVSDTTTGPTTGLTQSGMLNISSGVSPTQRAGISNSGYFGVAVAPSTSYSVQFWAKATAGFTGPLTVDLESTTGTIYAMASIPAITTAWAQYTTTLTTGADTPTTATNLFVISTTSPSANGQSIWFGATYLYPPSYENAANHLRIDLMQELAALKPAVFRVPGGNYLEGNSYATRFEWSNTIGPIDERPGHYDSAWGYWSTDGMGLDEYLQMAEEVGASPILAVYAGYTLNGASDTGTTLTNDVTDAVNELHYVLDPVTTSWGAERAANGHPAPYNVNYVEVGNEDFFSSTYSTRYPLFYNAIHSAFPQLQIIATSTSTGGSPYNVIDDHFYHTPAWFEANSNYFNNATRGSSQVFVGEWAADEGSPTNDMNSALGDACWLLGLERNSDLVTMESYAPLWVNVNGVQWNPDLIGFNNTTSYGSPSYYMQVMLANNHGNTVVSDTIGGASGLQMLVTKTGNQYYLTVVNTVGTSNASQINLSGVTSVSPTGTAITLSASASNATNSITNPTNIVPVTSTVTGLNTSFDYTFPAYSVTVLQLTAVDSPASVPVSASATTVTGTTTNVSLNSSGYNQSGQTFSWSATGPAAVSFSNTGTSTANTSTATFSMAGTYTLTGSVVNALNTAIATGSVTVNVAQTPTGFAISPATVTVAPGTTAQIVAGVTDQFGNQIQASAQPTTTWTVLSGGGSVNSLGVYTAPTSATGGTAVVQASDSAGTATATITIASQVAWYKADSTSGNTLSDSSGNNKNANITGSHSWTAGVSGDAIAFSGGYASLPTGIVGSLGDFTISAWIKVNTLSTWERVFDFGTGTNSYMFLTPDNGTNNTLRFAITDGGDNNEQRLNGPAIPTGVWTQVAVTLAGTVGTLYVNGVAVATNSAMTLHPSNLGNTNLNYLGKSQFSGDPAYSGSIDDFRIYNQALSPSQVLLLATPTVLVPAAAATSPVTGTVTGTTAALSVSATDVTAGASVLTYSWSTLGTPPAPVSFSANGSNVAQNTVATFTAAGTYVLQVSVVNPTANLPTTSTVTVVVSQTLSSIVVMPAATSLYDAQTAQFTATGYDQFGNVMATQPALAWSLASGAAGSVNSSGLYTAPASGPASDTVQATGTAVNGTGVTGTGVTGMAAANVTLSVIDGTSGNDNIRLIRSGANLLVYVNSTTPTWTVPFAGLNTLLISGQGGADTINIDFSAGSTPVPAGGLTVDGTGGNATLLVTGTGSNDTALVNSSTFTLDGSAINYLNLSRIVFNANSGIASLTQLAQPGNHTSLLFNSSAGASTTTADSLNISSGSFSFAAPIAGGGFQPITLAGLTIGGNASVTVGSINSLTDRSVLVLNSLSIGNAATLNLGGNDLILHNANANSAALTLSTLSTDLSLGYASGSWTGIGIDSLMAAADSTHLSALGIIPNATLVNFDGQPVAGTDVLIKFTDYGDLDLDGKIDGSDYSRIDNGFVKHLTGWFNGDLNYDGVVNGSDYTLMDNAFNSQGQARPSTQLATPAASIASAPFAPTPLIVAPDLQDDVLLAKHHRGQSIANLLFDAVTALPS
jgi:alpha-L-arabinofuranosidase